MLEQKKEEKIQKQKEEEEREAKVEEIRGAIWRLKNKVMDAYSTNAFDQMDDYRLEAIELLSSEYAPGCSSSADLLINLSDYLISQGNEEAFYELVGLIPDDCTLGIAEYVQMAYYNGTGRIEESNSKKKKT